MILTMDGETGGDEFHGPTLKTSIEETAAARDATRVESDPESTTRPRATGERQTASNPWEEVTTVTTEEDLSPGLPNDAFVDPGQADVSLPGEGDGGPGPKLATLSAWAGVVIAGTLVLDMVGVIDL